MLMMHCCVQKQNILQVLELVEFGMTNYYRLFVFVFFVFLKINFKNSSLSYFFLQQQNQRVDSKHRRKGLATKILDVVR